MTPTEFRARLAAQGHTLQSFATLTGEHPQTVRGWGSERHGRGVQAFPWWVGPVLAAIARNPSLTPLDAHGAPRWAGLLMAAYPELAA